MSSKDLLDIVQRKRPARFFELAFIIPACPEFIEGAIPDWSEACPEFIEGRNPPKHQRRRTRPL